MPRSSIDTALLPRDPATGDPLPPTPQPGFYPGFSTLSQSPFWDNATRDVVDMRVDDPPKRRFFTEAEWSFWTAVFAHLVPQTDRTPDRQIPLVAPLDERLYQDRTAGYRFEDMPQDRVAYRIGITAINAEAQLRFSGDFLSLPHLQQDLVLEAIQKGKPESDPQLWKQLPPNRFWQLILGDAIEAYYAHPWAWDEIGFGGPAYPRAYTRLERGEPEPWEVEEKRYNWLAPSHSVSDHVDGTITEDDDQSHQGSGGTH